MLCDLSSSKKFQGFVNEMSHNSSIRMSANGVHVCIFGGLCVKHGDIPF